METTLTLTGVVAPGAPMNRARSMLLSLVVGLGIVAFAAVPSNAEAQRGNKIDSVRFDVHASLGWWWAFGAGFRVDIPLVADGFIDGRVEDEFAITFGVEGQFVSWGNNRCNGYGCWGDWSVWPNVAAQWNFYLNDKWSIFPELGLAVAIYDCDRNPGNRGACASASPMFNFGARYHFAPPRFALLLRASYPFGFQVGITF
jgi:hypothetical protein